MIPGSGRFPGEGNANPVQYSCLENPMDRGAWWATVHGVPKELDTTERLNNNSLDKIVGKDLPGLSRQIRPRCGGPLPPLEHAFGTVIRDGQGTQRLTQMGGL